MVDNGTTGTGLVLRAVPQFAQALPREADGRGLDAALMVKKRLPPQSVLRLIPED